MDRQKIKKFARELLKAWDINLGEMYWKIIDGKIDRLSGEKIQKSVKLIKESF